MQSSQTKLSQNEIAQAWAKITIIRWRRKLLSLKVDPSRGSGGDLFKSFVFNVIGGAQGDVTKIELAFLYYGKFVDMGVGRDTKLGDKPVSRTSRVLGNRMLGSPRKAKKWYTKTLDAEVMRLQEIMQKEYGDRGRFIIAESINDKAING